MFNIPSEPLEFADGSALIEAHKPQWGALRVVAEIGSQVNVLCNGGNNGSATINVLRGETPYTYLWSTGGKTNSLTDVPAGDYF